MKVSVQQRERKLQKQLMREIVGARKADYLLLVCASILFVLFFVLFLAPEFLTFSVENELERITPTGCLFFYPQEGRVLTAKLPPVYASFYPADQKQHTGRCDFLVSSSFAIKANYDKKRVGLLSFHIYTLDAYSSDGTLWEGKALQWDKFWKEETFGLEGFIPVSEGEHTNISSYRVIITFDDTGVARKIICTGNAESVASARSIVGELVASGTYAALPVLDISAAQVGENPTELPLVTPLRDPLGRMACGGLNTQ